MYSLQNNLHAQLQEKLEAADWENNQGFENDEGKVC